MIFCRRELYFINQLFNEVKIPIYYTQHIFVKPLNFIVPSLPTTTHTHAFIHSFIHITANSMHMKISSSMYEYTAIKVSQKNH